MAGKARNSVIVHARRKTEGLAAKRRERESTLQALATDYHAAQMTAEQLVLDAEREAAELIAKAKRDAEATGEAAKVTVRKMLDTGETRQGVAELLDVSVSYVRGIDIATAKTKKTDTAGGGGQGAAVSEERGGVRVDA